MYSIVCVKLIKTLSVFYVSAVLSDVPCMSLVLLSPRDQCAANKKNVLHLIRIVRRAGDPAAWHNLRTPFIDFIKIYDQNLDGFVILNTQLFTCCPDRIRLLWNVIRFLRV